DDYVINAEALAYMRERALAAHVIARLVEHPDRCFSDRKAWNAHLDALGVTALKVNPDPALIATEGALWGSVKAHGLLPNTVIVSDDAGQFKIGSHGLCWVHASDWFTNSTPSPTRTAPLRPPSPGLSGSSTLISRPIVAPPPNSARLRCGRGSTASSRARPASSPSTACSHGSTPTSPNC